MKHTRFLLTSFLCASSVNIALTSSGCAAENATAPLPFGVSSPVQSPVKALARSFRPEEVQLLGGPFKVAQETDRKYLLRLEPDRMLSNLLKVSGLPPKAAPYGGWDTDGSGSIGHYLSALSHMAKATGDAELMRRMRYVVSEMARCQEANGDGGIYTHAFDKNNWFAALKKGQLIKTNVSGWYVTHKAMAGLRDAYFVAGDPQARAVFLKFCDWAVNVSANLSPETWQQMMTMGISEFGGPHEILADAYGLTGDRKYLETAEKFRQNDIFETTAKDSFAPLEHVHANAAIAKFLGYERIYEVGGGAAYGQAARNFYKTVVDNYSWSTGGNSQWEHFFPPSETSAKVKEPCGPETCNTYNMIKLAQQVWSLQPQASEMDFVERALFNSILPSQAPDVGGFVYYTPQRPGHYRVFSTDFDSFWCCVGTGMENHARYNELIYAKSAKRLFVNQFAPSVVSWREKNLKLTQSTNYPQSGMATLTVKTARPQSFTLSIRQPAWLRKGEMTLKVNGRAQTIASASGSYIDIPRSWKNGDKIEVNMPMHLRIERTKGTGEYASVFYGPTLLAGEMGAADLTPQEFRGYGPNADIKSSQQLAKKERPITDFPVLAKVSNAAPSDAQLLAQVKPVVGKPLEFQLTNFSTENKPVTLSPFYNVVFQRYTVQWPVLSAAELETRRKSEHAEFAWADLQLAEERRADLNDITLDLVEIGVNTSETAHEFQSDQSSSGGNAGDRWRDARGFFSYTMKVSPTDANALRVRYYGGDNGREFDILVDGQKVATQKLTARRQGAAQFGVYLLPRELTLNKTQVKVRFQPVQGNTAGGIFDVRTLRVGDSVKPLS